MAAVSSHPTPEELAAFQGRRLSEADNDRVSAHVDECTDCQQELDALLLGGVGGLLRARAAEAGRDTSIHQGDSTPLTSAEVMPAAPRGDLPAVPGYELLGELGRGPPARTRPSSPGLCPPACPPWPTSWASGPARRAASACG